MLLANNLQRRSVSPTNFRSLATLSDVSSNSPPAGSRSTTPIPMRVISPINAIRPSPKSPVLARPFTTRSSSSPTFPQNVTVIVGGGKLSISCIVEALKSDDKVYVFTNNPDELSAPLQAANLNLKNLVIRKLSYESGKDPLQCELLLKGIMAETKVKSIKVLQLRGVSTFAKGQTYDDVIYLPAVALLKGMAKAIPKSVQSSFILASSSVASVPGFDQVSPYAKARVKTDLEVMRIATEENISGGALRFDFVENNRNALAHLSPNHGASLRELTALGVHVCVGSEEDSRKVLAIQPVSESQAVEAILSPRLSQNGQFSIINAVGKQAYSQMDAYQFYTRLVDMKLRPLYVSFEAAKWAARHLSFAQITYGVPLLEHRSKNPEVNRPLPCDEFAALLDSKVKTLEEMYGQDQIYVQNKSPAGQLVKSAFKAFKKPEARSEFVRDVLPETASVLKQMIRI